jgi:hypothetical protein
MNFLFIIYFRNCVRTHIDVCFKEGKCRFACVENSCPGEYSMRLVSELLPPKDLNRLHKRIQEENIRQGNMNIFHSNLILIYFQRKSMDLNVVLIVHMLLLLIIQMIKSFVV